MNSRQVAGLFHVSICSQASVRDACAKYFLIQSLPMCPYKYVDEVELYVARGKIHVTEWTADGASANAG
jgi:hypothetical protein